MGEREILCSVCRQHAPISTMRYEKSGKHLICAKCRGAEEKKAETPRRIEPLLRSPIGGPKLLKYQCRNCRYTFRRTPTSPVHKCPNCGSKKLLRYEKLSADDLLDMADDDKYRKM